MPRRIKDFADLLGDMNRAQVFEDRRGYAKVARTGLHLHQADGRVDNAVMTMTYALRGIAAATNATLDIDLTDNRLPHRRFGTIHTAVQRAATRTRFR